MTAFYHLSSALLSVETVCLTKEPREQWRQSLLRITLSVHFRNYASSQQRARLLYSSNPQNIFFVYYSNIHNAHATHTREHVERQLLKKNYGREKKCTIAQSSFLC